MEKDKLYLIYKIVVLIDTEDSLEKLKKSMRDILNSQWNEEEKNKKLKSIKQQVNLRERRLQLMKILFDKELSIASEVSSVISPYSYVNLLKYR